MSKKTVLISMAILIIGLCFYCFDKFGSNPGVDSFKTSVNAPQKANEPTLVDKALTLEPDSVKDINLKKDIKKETNSKPLSQGSSSQKIKEAPLSLSNTKIIKEGLQLIIKDEAENLLENVKVELIEMKKEEKIFFSFLTKKDGQAELPYIDDASEPYYQLKISHPDFSLKVFQYFFPNNYSPGLPLIIVLTKGFSVKGVARDSSGNVLEGVEIHLKVIKQMDYRSYQSPPIKTNKDGVFEFNHVPPGKILFYGEGKGQILVESKIYKVPKIKEINLVFQKGREHSIKITDNMGVGIAKAEVTYFFDVGGKKTSKIIETNAEGFCSFLLAQKRNERLIISHPSYLKYDTKELYNQKDTEPENVILLKGLSLSGKVTDKITALPVPNLFVSINTIEHTQWQSSRTNNLGVYEFKSMGQGDYSISAQGMGYKELRNLSCHIDNEKENIKNIELEKGLSCQFKLIDGKSKAPISKKAVRNLEDWMMRNDSVFSNEEGIVNLPMIEYGAQQLNINLQVTGYANKNYTFSPTTEIITLELLPEAKLQVFVKEPRDQTLDETQLYVSYNDPTGMKKGELIPKYNSAKNCFDIFGLSEGKEDLIFNLYDNQPIYQSVDLVAGEVNTIKLDLEPPYLLIFKIKSNNNNISFAELKGQINIVPDPENRFNNDCNLEYNEEKYCFEYALDLQENTSFSLYFPFHLPTPMTMIHKDPKGYSEFDFVLTKGLGVEGAIINSFGQKISDTFIAITPINNENRSDRWVSYDEYGNSYNSNASQNIQNLNGNFSAYGLLTGKYQIKVIHYDYLPFEAEIELKGQSILDYQIILKKGSQITGTVSSPSGILVPNAKIDLMMVEIKEDNSVTVDFRNIFYSTTDSKGLFVFKNIPKGNYHLKIACSLGQIEKYEVIVGEAQNIMGLNIKLEESIELTGVVVDEQEVPVNNILIYLSPVDYNQGKQLNCRTETSGNFIFNNVCDMKYSLTINSEEGYCLIDNEKMVMGSDKNVKLVLKKPIKTSIKGHVYSPDGKECLNYYLSFLDVENKTQGELYDTKISRSGFEFTIRGDETKMVKIIATSTEYALGESEIFSLPLYQGQPITVTLKNKIDLELKVIDMQTRKPIKNALANISLIDQSKAYDSSNGQNKEQGIIKLFPLTTGKYKLTVRAAGFVEFLMEIDVEEKNATIEVSMSKGSVIKGQIQSIENKPLAFISVFASSPKEGTLSAATDENGFFEIRLVKPGVYYVYTTSESKIQLNRLLRGVLLTVEDGKEINISQEEIEKQTKTIRVNVKLKGTDIIKKEVEMHYAKSIDENQKGAPLISIGDENGNAAFLNVPKGEFLILVNKGKTNQVSFPITVTADQDVTVEIPVNNE